MDINSYLKANWVFFKQIYNDDIVLNAVKEKIMADTKKVVKYSEMLRDGKWQKLVGQAPILILSAIVLCLKSTYERFIKMGLSESVFYDTMSDIKIWGEDYRNHNNGDVGLTEINWLRLHINCEIFKFGRLQFQVGRFYFAKSAEINGRTVRYGDRCYYIHIPRGAKLDSVSCKKSITLAADTLVDVFRNVPTDFMLCHSWLLSSKNSNFIKPTSNIAKFASLFRVVGEKEEASEHLRWIFDMSVENKVLEKNKKKNGVYVNLSNFEPKTSLQADAKDYIMKGGELTCGKGVVLTKNVIG